MGSQVLYIKGQNRGILKVLWVAAGTMGGPPPDPPREEMLPRSAPLTQRCSGGRRRRFHVYKPKRHVNNFELTFSFSIFLLWGGSSVEARARPPREEPLASV